MPITGLKGEALANALMKAETKAKRRVTLSLCGLSWPDESEVESIPEARTVVVDSHTGEILDERPATLSQITSADDKMWERWETLKDEALSLGINVPNLRLPLFRKELQDWGVTIREQVAAKREQLAREDAARAEGKSGAASPASPRSAARSGDAVEEFPTSTASAPDMVTMKGDDRWKDWLATERAARVAGLKVDTSGVKLPLTGEALLAAITDLKEQIAEAKDGKAEEEEAF